MMTKNIMQRIFAITAIIEKEETRNLGIAIMKECMLKVYAKIAISMNITEKEE